MVEGCRSGNQSSNTLSSIARRTLPSDLARRRTASGLSTLAFSITNATGTLRPALLMVFDRGRAIDFAGAHQDADAALDQLGVLHVHVDHQVFVHVAQRVMAPVVIMFRIIFCAVPAFMRVEPEMTSGPTSATMAMSAASASGFPDCR